MALILQLAAFAIAEGPEVYSLVMKVIAGIQKEFKTPEERIKALNDLLLLMSPMEKEV